MDEAFEAVVIGSGFGGTIIALSLANKFHHNNSKSKSEKKVCVMERGQWWLSHEMNFRPKAKRKTNPNMREFLEDSKKPYHFWAHPDDVNGIIELLSSNRSITKMGLYDYKVLGNVHSIQACGVGGGSLIYSNVTIAPPKSVYENWPTQFIGKGIEDYFDTVRQFLGVNRITTTSGLGTNLLEKTLAFQEAGQALIDKGNADIVNIKDVDGKTVGDFDLDLSITDIPAGLFSGPSPPSVEELRRLLETQENICQRQGRCVLGCIPNARHTLSTLLLDAMNPVPPGKPRPIEVRELCDVYDIEFSEGEEYKYKIKYFQIDPKLEQRKEKYVKAKLLVIGAGSLGSTELLMKCKDRGSLEISDLLGSRFFTNGDLLGFMTLDHRTIDVTRGPINTSRVSFKTKKSEFAYTIEDTTLSRMVAPIIATMFELHAHGAKDADIGLLENLIEDINLLYRFRVLDLLSEGISTTSLIRLFTIMWNDPSVRKVLVEIFKKGASKDQITRRFIETILTWAFTDHANPYASPEERISRFYAFSGMGRGEMPGAIRLKPNWRDMEARDDPGEKIFVQWPAAENNRTLGDIANGMRKLAGEIDKGGFKRVYTPFWNFDKPEESTAVILHPLGGCSMGTTVDNGVVDSYGRVFWNDGSPDRTKVYPDLYVADGSVLPEPPGANPTMLISAIAFRTAELIIEARPEHPPPPDILVPLITSMREIPLTNVIPKAIVEVFVNDMMRGSKIADRTSIEVPISGELNPGDAVKARQIIGGYVTGFSAVILVRSITSSVITQHNDNNRTGANLNEAILNTSNVNPCQFGKLFTRKADGQIYAQPLYLCSLEIPGKGIHNVVFAATMHNTVYAFDADDLYATHPLWEKSLGPSVPLPDPNIGPKNYGDITVEAGIVSTPVISPANDIIYIVSANKDPKRSDAEAYSHWLHALDIRTGDEKLGGPARISACYTGNGDGSVNGIIDFESHRQLQRSALLLSQGRIYIAFASYGDETPAHGWVMAYDADTLKQLSVFNTTPESIPDRPWFSKPGMGTVWQGGQGLAADDKGNVYFITGNGEFNGFSDPMPSDLGDCIIKLTPDLKPADWFSPHNNNELNILDLDLGSGGVLLIPDSNLLLGGGKEAKLYLIDRDNMGHFNPDNDHQIRQSFCISIINNQIRGGPVYWNGDGGHFVYLSPQRDHLKSYRLIGGLFRPAEPISKSKVAIGSSGGWLSLSSNGKMPGTGIVWLSEGDKSSGVLHAFDATRLEKELWNSKMEQSRDDLGIAAKFCPPTIANGKVYMATFSGYLAVYGLLS